MTKISLLLTSLFILISPLYLTAQLCEDTRSTAHFDLNACKAFANAPSMTDYSEFTAVLDTFPGGAMLSTVGDSLYRRNGLENKHSCTAGVDGSIGLCVGSLDDCNYVADHDAAIRFTIRIEPGADGFGRLSELSFYETAVDTFAWIGGATGINNPPSRYAVRVIKDGMEVFRQIDIPTSYGYSHEVFDFSEMPDFKVLAPANFHFEILPYCTVDNGGDVNAWDIDDVRIASNLYDNAKGGNLAFTNSDVIQEVCVSDGIADFVDASITDAEASSYAYVITDADSSIIAYDVSLPYDFEPAAPGVCLLWHVAYHGSLDSTGTGQHIDNMYGCYALSNSIRIERNEVPVLTVNGQSTQCGFDNGSAAISISGGVEPFSIAWSTGADTEEITDLAAGGYSVTIIDGNGCMASGSTNIADSESPTASIDVVHTTCGFDNGRATASAVGGVGPYTYSWSTGASTSEINNLAAGDYSATVSDELGCTDVISVTINDSESPSISASGTATQCGEDNGTATALATGGVGPYDFIWSNGANTASISNLAAGVYSVTVSDDLGCVDSTTVNIAPSTAPDVAVQSTPTLCGLDNGTASATTTLGTSPYTYIWSNGESTSEIYDLAPGNYRVTVSDALGCTDWASVDIDDSTPPTIRIDGTNTTCDQDNGQVSTTVSGGTMPYTYRWSNGATTSDLSDVSDGTYRVTVTDANGCTDATAVDILDTETPKATGAHTNTTCGDDNGTATVSIAGGQSPYTYIWSTGETTQSIANLAAGGYRLTISDSNGCTDWIGVTIEDSESPSASPQGTATTCGDDNGSATVVVSGGISPYTYSWSTGANTESVSGLAAGDYEVTVTDALGCTGSTTVSVGASTAPEVSTDGSATTCAEDNGSASASVSGGATPYIFIWSNGETTASIDDLAAGNYRVTVSDAMGCTDWAAFDVGDSETPSISGQAMGTSCAEDNGSISSTTSGGLAPYTYIWSNGDTTAQLSDLAPGNYRVTVTDANGCTDWTAVDVADSELPEAEGSATGTSCGDPTGTASVVASGGIAPYTYVWSTGANTAQISGLEAGNYRVTISDANGCTDWTAVEVDGSTPPNIALNATNTKCGGDNGSITSSTSDGATPYTYIWSNGETTANVSGLAAGNYRVTVTDANGCTDWAAIDIETSTLFTVNFTTTMSSCGGANGSATAEPINGTAPYTYVWSTGATTPAISDVLPGSYQVTVTDNEGCEVVANTTVMDIMGPNINLVSLQTTCGENNGALDAQVSGGSAPYAYLWSNGLTTSGLTDLSPGSYAVTVTDSLGCTASASMDIADSESPQVQASATGTTCGLNDGSVSAAGMGGTAPYTYDWSNWATVDMQNGLAAGDYTVTVTDAVGCTGVATVRVEDSSTPEVSITPVHTSCGFDNGGVFTTVNMGQAPYSFTWSNGANGSDLLNLAAGTYSVTVTDNLGCTATASTSVSSSDQPQISVTATGTTCGMEDGSATAAVSGGLAPYSILWSNGDTSLMIDNLASGTYSAQVTDANGCVNVAVATVAASLAPEIYIQKEDTECNMNNGSVEVVITSGVSPLTTLWSTGDQTNRVEDLAAGLYTVTVTDKDGCSSTATATILPSEAPRGGVIEGGPFDFCSEGNADMVGDLILSGASGSNRAFVLVNVAGQIERVFTSMSDLEAGNLDDLSVGLYRLYHLSYEEINGLSVGSAFGGLSGCFGLSNAIDINISEPIMDPSSSSIHFTMDSCYAFTDGNNQDYSEFAGVLSEDPDCASIAVIGGSLYRDNPSDNEHSCTPGRNGTPALCVSSAYSCNFDPMSEKALKLDLEISPAENGSTKLSAISFYEQAPENFDWIDGANGVNNYPTLFAVRLYIDGLLAYESVDQNTARSWNLVDLDLSSVDTEITSTTAVSLELFAYCQVNNGSSISAWDIEDLKIETSCTPEMKAGTVSGGPFLVCLDGVADYLNGISLSDATGENQGWLMADESGSIIALFDDLSEVEAYDVEQLGEGNFKLYHIVYTDLDGLEVGENMGDFAGCYLLSDAVSVQTSYCGMRLSVYPNPSTGQFTLNTGFETETAMVTIFDNFGRKVYQMMVNRDNSYKIPMLMENLDRGMYRICLESDGHMMSKNLMIIK